MKKSKTHSRKALRRAKQLARELENDVSTSDDEGVSSDAESDGSGVTTADRLRISTFDNCATEKSFRKIEGLVEDDQTLECSPSPDTYSVVNANVLQAAVSPDEIGVE
eukprot:9704187-Prorocentrum_lima.AAC.1